MDTADAWRTYATICRLCLQKDGFMLGIFNNIQGKDKSICKKIMDCTALQISAGDGLPNVICHRCLYKIEFCLEFRQLCFVSDATLRQINNVTSNKEGDATAAAAAAAAAGTAAAAAPHPTVYEQLVPGNEENVVMVVDPNALDYDTEYETDNERQSDNENVENNETFENRNVTMCTYCDQAFTDKAECEQHELTGHNQAVPYTCVQCDMGFADRLQYSAHLKSVHQNDKPYNCPQCDRTFARRSDLRKHTIVHTGVKPYTCHICFKSFSRNTNLSKHLRIHSGQKAYLCRKCPKTFFSKIELSRHSIVHSTQKRFSCNYCHMSFGQKDKLTRHEKRHFPQQNAEDKTQELQILRENLMSDYNYGPMLGNEATTFDANERQEKQEGWTSSENMVIQLDPFSHDNFNNTESAMKSENQSDVEQTNGEMQMETDFSKTTNTDDNRNLPTVPDHITSAGFNHNDDYKSSNDEKQSVDESKLHPCSICNTKFPTPESAYYHQACHAASPIRPYSCHVCSKSFIRKRELDRHQATHSGVKPFKCSKCSKGFGRKDKLMRHMRIHDVKKNHVCTVCNTTFNRRDSLIQHIRTHNKSIKEENE